MHTYKIAVIAGDAIGREVIPAGIAALEAATRGSGVSLSFTELPWGCEYYARSGRMMDEDGFDRIGAFDAIYLGPSAHRRCPTTSLCPGGSLGRIRGIPLTGGF